MIEWAFQKEFGVDEKDEIAEFSMFDGDTLWRCVVYCVAGTPKDAQIGLGFPSMQDARKLQFEVFAQVLPRSRELPFFGWKLDNAKIEIIKARRKQTEQGIRLT